MLVSQSRKLISLDEKTTLDFMADKAVITKKSNIWQNLREQLQVAVSKIKAMGHKELVREAGDIRVNCLTDRVKNYKM